MPMSMPQSSAPDPDLVLAGVKRLRGRMQRLMGDRWGPFSRQLDRLYARAAEASGEEQKQLVDELLRFGLSSLAAVVFKAIFARAVRLAAMKREAKTRKRPETREGTDEEHDVVQQVEQFEEALRSARPRPPLERAAKAPVEEATSGSEAERGAMDVADAIDHHVAAARERPRAMSAPPVRAKPPAAKPKAKRPGLPKAKRPGPPKAKRAGRTKAKSAGRTKAKRAAPLDPMRRHRAAAERDTSTERRSPRFVNLNFTNPDGRLIGKKRPLVAGHVYKLSVGIGELAKESIVENAVDNPVPTELLPPNPEGHWLQIAAVSDQFKILSVGRWLFLPTEGPAWTCSCKPGGAHECQPNSRRDNVEFTVRAQSAPGQATLRLTIYFQKSIVQSLLVSATIARPGSARGSNTALVDYNLTNSLTDLESIQPRALSVMMNESDDGSHTLIFNGAPEEVVALHLNIDQMTAAVTMMRQVMRDIHIEDKGPRDIDKVNRYDAQNGKSTDKFIADLEELAGRGYDLWTALWYDKPERWENLELLVGQSDIIHIGRKDRSPSVFPWAMVYDIPIDIGAPENNRHCRLLEPDEWKKFQDAAGDVPSRCPFEATHGENVICPYGFWGIRYEIEQPPSLQKGRSLWRKILVDPQPLSFVVALSEDLDAGLTNAHLKTLRNQHQKAFTIREGRTRDKIRDELGILDIEVVYFYCHGYTNPLPGGTGTTPSLGVGRSQVIAPPDLMRWRMHTWPKGHWEKRAPLVFINGCHTADTTPQTLVNFVDIFSATLNAAGVIGTEITLHQLVANEVAQTFLKEFQRGLTVGKALRQARGGLLRKGNLLGLVYTAYCSADLQFSAGIPGPSPP